MPPSASAKDALAHTSRALASGTPSLDQLQSECETLIRNDLAALKGDLVLKVASIFSYEEILTKLAAAHGDKALSCTGLRTRIRQAKTTVANDRNVTREVLSEELKENKDRRGAADRKRELMVARQVHTKRAKEEDPDESVGAPVMHPYYQETRPRGSKGGSGAGTVEEGAADEDQGEATDVSGAGATNGKHQELHTAPSPLRNGRSRARHATDPGPLEPFDPRPYGQPYAGTSLYVPGFRTDGTVSWQEWLRQHPHFAEGVPMQDYEA